VSRAEIDLSPSTDPHSDVVYQRAADNFTTLKATAPLVVEEIPSVYVYRLRMGSHVQTGIAGCYSLDEYDRHLIKTHERTRRDKEDDRTRHMLALRAQTGPVFLTYRASPAVDQIVDSITTRAPLFDFTAPDAVEHTIWRAADDATTQLVRAFADLPALYIADGHHRAASAARTRQKLRTTQGAGEWDAFLAVAFPDAQMQILPYNRVVSDLASQSPAVFIHDVRARYSVRDGAPAPARKGEVSMYLAGRWYVVDLGSASLGTDATSRLDVSRLQDGILGPLLKIGDVRTDPRIDFVGGARGVGALETLVDSGRAAVAFSMYPVLVSDLMEIADAGALMPPKSTWFEPKLRDGLLSHLI
jgi:uncharacterized protein (DUF1015 family)